jgi:hypothetical protein
VHLVLMTLFGWVAAQPLVCVVWAYALRGRRAFGGN